MTTVRQVRIRYMHTYIHIHLGTPTHSSLGETIWALTKGRWFFHDVTETQKGRVLGQVSWMQGLRRGLGST